MWTISTPFIDREIIFIKLWQIAFDKLDIPKKEMKLVWFNQCKNKLCHDLINEYFNKHKDDFKEAILIDEENISVETVENEHMDLFYKKRKLVSEAMNKLNEQREGNLLLIEDDIIFPPNAFKKMKAIFDYDEDIIAVTGPQISRQPKWPNKLLAWDWEYKLVFGDKDSSDETNYNPLNRKEEGKGIEFIGASATGFILIKSKFMDNYIHESGGIHGQDVMLGLNIYKAKKKLAMCWEIPLVHMGKDNNGRVKFFRKDHWSTEVIDEFGTMY